MLLKGAKRPTSDSPLCQIQTFLSFPLCNFPPGALLFIYPTRDGWLQLSVQLFQCKLLNYLTRLNKHTAYYSGHCFSLLLGISSNMVICGMSNVMVMLSADWNNILMVIAFEIENHSDIEYAVTLTVTEVASIIRPEVTVVDRFKTSSEMWFTCVLRHFYVLVFALVYTNETFLGMSMYRPCYKDDKGLLGWRWYTGMDGIGRLEEHDA